jgi:protein-S-isoprenylcysteine O-methyltransferase Ste14
MPRHGVCVENPINGRAQVVFVFVFLIVWGIYSFFLRYGLNFKETISLFVSVPIGIISFIIGVYFVRKSESVVFSSTEGKVIFTEVYGFVRHPMYLGHC